MTLRIDYRSRAFPSSYAFRSGTLSGSWEEVLWAAITFGRPSIYHVFRHGEASYHPKICPFTPKICSLEPSTGGLPNCVTARLAIRDRSHLTKPDNVDVDQPSEDAEPQRRPDVSAFAEPQQDCCD
jgi:hypothetical protein